MSRSKTFATFVFISFSLCVHAQKRMADCFKLGFDPAKLACSSCDLLTATEEIGEIFGQFQEECRFCCQPEYDRVDKSGAPTYTKAVLKFDPNPMMMQLFGNVAEFLDEYQDQDRDMMSRIELMPKQGNTNMMMMGLGSPRSPELILYGRSNPSDKTSKIVSKERIDLSGDLWSKDVLWEMLYDTKLISKEYEIVR